MVIQCSKLFYSKDSTGFLQQDSQSSCRFGMVEYIVGGLELWRKKNVSLGKDFIFQFHRYFSTSSDFIS